MYLNSGGKTMAIGTASLTLTWDVFKYWNNIQQMLGGKV